MATIERITSERALLFKSIRRQALLDAPTAFGSTYERESQLSDETCGPIGAYLEEAYPEIAHVIKMWVAPLPEDRRRRIPCQRGTNVGGK